MSWYYAQNDQALGPVSAEDLNLLLRTGRVSADNPVWTEGMADWRPAREAFSGAVSATLPPFAPSRAESAHKAADATRAPVGRLRFTFTGSWLGYYRVWLVGLVLTVLTLGLYSPWARIRTKRYLYAHTRLGDDGFGYHANPWSILAGNLLMVVVLVAWVFSGLIHPLAPVALPGLGVLLIPWVMSRALRFNARATSWRGLRFGFAGGGWGSLWVHGILPLLSIGVLWPLCSRARRRWLINHLHYGDTPFRFDASVAALYGIYLKGMLFFVPAGLCYVGVALQAYMMNAAEHAPGGMVFMPLWAGNIATAGPQLLPYMIPVALFGIDFLRARIFTWQWNGTTIGGHACQAYMPAWVTTTDVALAPIRFAPCFFPVRSSPFKAPASTCDSPARRSRSSRPSPTLRARSSFPTDRVARSAISTRSTRPCAHGPAASRARDAGLHGNTARADCSCSPCWSG